MHQETLVVHLAGLCGECRVAQGCNEEQKWQAHSGSSQSILTQTASSVLSQYFIADEAATQRQPDDKQSLTRCHSSVRVTEGCVFDTPFEAKEKRTQATRCGRAFEVPFGTHFLHPRFRPGSAHKLIWHSQTLRQPLVIYRSQYWPPKIVETQPERW